MTTMRAMVLNRMGPVGGESGPLDAEERPVPAPGPGQLLLRVAVCGVCHTELDEIEGRTAPAALPVIPGHQAVGAVAALGAGVRGWREGDRAGAAWIYSACGECAACRAGDENLCPRFRATGRDADGGYAEYMVLPAPYAFPIPGPLADTQAAPLLCAGAIGYRSLRLCGLEDGQPLGLTGFGASAHLVLKMARARYPRSPVSVWARSEAERAFARELGAAWTGDTRETPPEPLQAILDTTPAWLPVCEALRHLRPGGRLVINAIRKEEADRPLLATLDYPAQLWLEKEVKSVANVTRRDVMEFLALAADLNLAPVVRDYPLGDANRALRDLKAGRHTGAKVLLV